MISLKSVLLNQKILNSRQIKSIKVMDEDLENLKKKRLQELQQQMSMQEAMDNQQDQQRREFKNVRGVMLSIIS